VQHEPSQDHRHHSSSSLAGCGVVDLISKGVSYSNAVAGDLEHDTGLKPEVATAAFYLLL
jgi:hypothetical protein